MPRRWAFESLSADIAYSGMPEPPTLLFLGGVKRIRCPVIVTVAPFRESVMPPIMAKVLGEKRNRHSVRVRSRDGSVIRGRDCVAGMSGPRNLSSSLCIPSRSFLIRRSNPCSSRTRTMASSRSNAGAPTLSIARDRLRDSNSY